MFLLTILDYQTQLDINSSMCKYIMLNDAHYVQNDEMLEGKLWKTLKDLAATEGNIYLFDTSKKKGLSTIM